MSDDMRRHHKLMKKTEPLVAVLQEAGIRESSTPPLLRRAWCTRGRGTDSSPASRCSQRFTL
jgi:hypothetical protein